MSGIYIIKNAVNGKVYVGQSIDIPLRNKSELYKKKVNSVLAKDIYVYGVNNFEIDILEFIDFTDKKKLNERECYWISKYNSIDSRFGYNISAGNNSKKPQGKYINKATGVRFDYKYIRILEDKNMGKRISFVVSDEDYERLRKASFDGKYMKHAIQEAINLWIKRVDYNAYNRMMTQKNYDANK